MRRAISALRSDLTTREHREKSDQVAERIIQLLSGRKLPLTIAAYMPNRGEVDIEPVMEYCWAKGVRVIIPKSEPTTRQLRFYYVEGLQDLASEAGAYGIREPHGQAKEWNDQDDLELVLVPGLAIDDSFARLGYGGGYYDRWLARLAQLKRVKPLYVFPAFELQRLRAVPSEEHDVRMDIVVTEQRLLRREGQAIQEGYVE